MSCFGTAPTSGIKILRTGAPVAEGAPLKKGRGEEEEEED